MEKNNNRKQVNHANKKRAKKSHSIDRDFFNQKKFHFRPEKPIPVPVFIERASSNSSSNAFIRASLASLIDDAQSLLLFLN
jgi:hypothetical protein